MVNIPEAIAKRMDMGGISQAELSRLSGVSKSSLSRYLGGDDIPASKLMAIANALGTTVDELLGLSTRKNNGRNQGQVFTLTPEESALLSLYRQMDGQAKARVMEYAAFQADAHPLNQGLRVAESA